MGGFLLRRGNLSLMTGYFVYMSRTLRMHLFFGVQGVMKCKALQKQFVSQQLALQKPLTVSFLAAVMLTSFKERGLNSTWAKWGQLVF